MLGEPADVMIVVYDGGMPCGGQMAEEHGAIMARSTPHIDDALLCAWRGRYVKIGGGACNHAPIECMRELWISSNFGPRAYCAVGADTSWIDEEVWKLKPPTGQVVNERVVRGAVGLNSALRQVEVRPSDVGAVAGSGVMEKSKVATNGSSEGRRRLRCGEHGCGCGGAG